MNFFAISRFVKRSRGALAGPGTARCSPAAGPPPLAESRAPLAAQSPPRRPGEMSRPRRNESGNWNHPHRSESNLRFQCLWNGDNARGGGAGLLHAGCVTPNPHQVHPCVRTPRSQCTKNRYHTCKRQSKWAMSSCGHTNSSTHDCDCKWVSTPFGCGMS